MVKARQRKLQAHDYANTFPMLGDDELIALADSISKNGLIDPIMLYKGKILDGRNRYAACNIAKVKPKLVSFGGDDKAALTYVWEKNFSRRHLSTTDKSFAAATHAEHLEATRSQERNGEATVEGRSTAIAAEIMGVSEASVKRAKAIRQKGDAKLIEAATSGEVSLLDAAKAAQAPKAQQRKALSAVKSGAAETLSEALDQAEESEPEKPVTAEDLCAENNREIESFCRGLTKYFEDNVPQNKMTKREGLIGSAASAVKAACTTIRMAKTVLCPRCEGEKCDSCKNVGYLPKHLADQVERTHGRKK